MMSNICREAEIAWFASQYFFDIRRYGNTGLGALSHGTTDNKVSALAFVGTSVCVHLVCVLFSAFRTGNIIGSKAAGKLE